MEVYAYEGCGYSIGVRGEAEGVLVQTEDGRITMIDNLGKEMPLGKLLRNFTNGAQPIRITIDNLHYAPGSVNKKKTLYP